MLYLKGFHHWSLLSSCSSVPLNVFVGLDVEAINKKGEPGHSHSGLSVFSELFSHLPVSLRARLFIVHLKPTVKPSFVVASIFACLLWVLYFKYTPGVYLTAIQSNPIFLNLEKHIFSFYCLFVCGVFASHMCVCSSVKRSGPKSKVEYNNSLCLTKLYGKASNLHLFTAFSFKSCTRLHTGSHELTSK